jgi:hypothetical protein
MINTTMSKLPSDDFFKDIDYPNIIDNIKGIFTSDGTINTLLDFERVLDEADLYAYKNWELGELVNGPISKKYTVTCVFMYPEKLMPNPKGGKRLTHLGCTIHFKKTSIEVPVKIEGYEDFESGTHYPKMVEKPVWLVRIEIPRELMNDVREGSIDLAGQTIELDDLDSAYEDDLDKEGTEEQGEAPAEQGMAQPPMAGGMPPQPMAPPQGAM